MYDVNKLRRSKLKLTGILAITALVGFSLTALPVRPAVVDNPMLFISERRDIHLSDTHARENLFKVVQGEKSFYGLHEKNGDKLFSEADFYNRIDEGRKRAPSVPVVVFVHGCCVSFGEQLYQGLELKKGIDAASADHPVVIDYDWAAPFSYATSLVHAGGAQSRFDKFMRRLASRYGAENIVIVAHSLGTVLTQNFIERLEDKTLKPFAAIVFSRADLDGLSFADCLPDLKAHSKRLMVLSSDNDPNIYFSSLLRKWGVDFFQAVVLPVRVTGPLVKKLEPDKDIVKEGGGEAVPETVPESVPETVTQTVTQTASETEESSDQKTGSENEVRTAAAGDEAPPVLTEKQRHKGLTKRLGQVKVAREFGRSVEVYDMSAFRIGHGIPYHFIGDLLFNDCRNYERKREANGVLVVRRARH